MSAPVVIRGSLIPFLQRSTYDFDPQRAWIYSYHFKGASQDLMSLLQQDYARAGIACRLTFNQGDTADLDVEDSTQQLLIDTWQIVGNEESRDGLSHPYLFLTLTNAGFDANKIIASMRLHLQQNDDPTALFAPGGDFSGAPQIVKDFYTLQVRGATEYRHGQYVLRHTTNIPNRYTVSSSDFGVEQVLNTGSLLTEITTGWTFPCPIRLTSKIGFIDSVPPIGVRPPSQPGYTIGWLKSTSTETTAAYNRVDIVTEYTYEQWPTNTYYQVFTGSI